MADDIIKEVKIAEEKALAIIQEAEKTWKEKLFETEEAMKRLINEARHQAETRYQMAIAEAKAEAEKKKAQIAIETQEKIQKLTQIPKGRIDQAISLVIEKIKEQWGWQESRRS